MAAAAAGAQVGLQFLIKGDNSEFKSAVAEAKSAWTSATTDMAKSGGGIADNLLSATSKIGDFANGVASQLESAFSKGADGVEALTLKGFESLKSGAEGLLDTLGSLGERWGGAFGKRLGDAIASIAKSGIDPVADKLTKKLAEVTETERFKALAGGIESVAAELDKLTNSATGAVDKVKALQEGFQHAIEVARDERLAAPTFNNLTASLDKQIAQQDRAREIIGKTADQVARLRAEWALADAGIDQEKMAEDQKAKYEDLVNTLQASFAQNEQAKAAEQQEAAYKRITEHLERQIVLEMTRAGEMSKSAGQLAQERATLDAINRMRATGRELTVDELARIREYAGALASATDGYKRLALERQTAIGFDKQEEQLRIEAATLTMAAGPAAAYKAELQAIARFREQNVTLTDDFAAKIRAEAQAVGTATTSLARMRDEMQLLRDSGQIVSRSLESAFSKFMEGTKVSWREMVSDMLAELAKLTLRTQLLQPLFGGGSSGNGWIANWLGGLFNGGGGGIGQWTTTTQGFAAGGPVAGGVPIVVGEKGPELFVPQGSGSILPNDKLMKSSSEAPQLSLTINAPNSTQESVAALKAEMPGLILQTFADARERGILR